MLTKKLLDDLRPELIKAKEVWFAVALINDVALNQLLTIIPKNVKQQYLVGIDLPTTPSALAILKEQLSSTFKAGIFKTSKTFHPKVYLTHDGSQFSAIVGSGNLTEGGLTNNIEMSLITRDQAVCQSLLEWFSNLYSVSFPLSDENIASYRAQFDSLSASEQKIKSVRDGLKLNKDAEEINPLECIDFSDRYFSYSHHAAFRPELVRVRTPEANQDRKTAYDRFYDLHEQIFPKFSQHGLTRLKHHKSHKYIVSHYFHADGYTSNELNAMWLSYGKAPSIISQYQDLFGRPQRIEQNLGRKAQSFINHARLQVIIHHDSIGIWLFFGKRNGGSTFDRDNFRKQMKDSAYRDSLFEMIKSLPPSYFISLDSNSWPKVTEFKNVDSFYEYCQNDHIHNHFIIGRDYGIEDSEMSESNLPNVVLTEFERLYPFYDKMRDKTFG